MKNISTIWAIALFCVSNIVCQLSFAGETIVGKEIEGYFYSDGKMKRSDPIFEITYYIEGDKITRTRVYNIIKKEVIPDNTVYTIQKQLWSDPTKNMSLGDPCIRAVGQPGTDAIEILVIEDKYIQTVKSTSNYFVVSRLKRVK